MGFQRELRAEEAGWLDCLERMAAAGREAAVPLAGRASGRVALGRGGGGDITIELDRAAEEAMVSVLESCAPESYSLVAEERGIELVAGAPWRVMLDPVDGSLNAKRGLEPFGSTIAVARGETLRDVRVAHTCDYTRGHRFAAVRGAGARMQREPARRAAAEPCCDRVVDPADSGIVDATPRDGSVEVVLFEGGRPDALVVSYQALAALSLSEPDPFLRVRQIGSLALSLCLVAQGIADVLVAPVPSRAVDIAAGLLILEESGGGAAALDGSELRHQPLDLERRAPFVAWRLGLPGPAVAARARTYFGS